ncbi:MAG TPA: TPM domain-containing protein [Bacteroidales bacterium]|nr:TPM domain-containing protein [Bacteroidales bacterium]
MKASSFFSKEQQSKIVEAIKEAENESSGEVRVHIETRCHGDVLDRAAWIFGKLGMHKTKERNGVLFYLAVRDRKFAVIGDAGINAKVPEGFWDDVKELMAKRFAEGKFTEGLSEGIILAGDHLKKHFPHQKDDINELSDEISFDKP